MNRYATANSAEKANFTKLAKLVITHFGVEKRELKGDKSRVKYIFDLKKNNPFIHTLEFGTKNDGEIVNIRLVVSRPTLKSDFYKAILKGKGVCDAKASYGGIVIHFDATETSAPEILTFIGKLADASEVIELDSKRTYCDPPAEWIEGNDGRQGVVKAEKAPKAPKAEKEEIAPVDLPEATEMISDEDLALAQAKADMEDAA